MSGSKFKIIEMSYIGELVATELSMCQKNQRRNLASYSADETNLITHLLTYFKHVRHLDPPQDRLASSLFLNAPLRSGEG